MLAKLRRGVELVCMALTIVLCVPLVILAFVIVMLYALIGGPE